MNKHILKIKELVKGLNCMGMYGLVELELNEIEKELNTKTLDDLDLKTLEHVKFIFDIHSDMSSKTLGYTSLCTLIDKYNK